MNRSSLLEMSPAGLYCPEGDFYIDPWRPVPSALITHAHADHARPGSERYLTSEVGRAVLQQRLGRGARIRGLAYGERIVLNGVEVSFHPAGHILGSAQVRVAWRGEVWVVSGDYKLGPDATCTPFEPVPCHTFVTESTFGLPVFRWDSPGSIMDDIRQWWIGNQGLGRTSLLYVYALGKAQRILAALEPSEAPILVHGAVESMNRVYRSAGVALCPTRRLTSIDDRELLGRALVLAPGSAAQPGWLRRFPAVSTGFASGWMRIRGFRRRRALDRGFALSDHCDWNGLLEAVEATGAETVWVAHGYADVLARYLNEKGLCAEVIASRPSGLDMDAEPLAEDEGAGTETPT